jgi:hypothetical protein
MKDTSTIARLRGYMGTGLRGPNWDTLLAALGNSDDANTALARWAYDQASIAAATGTYLDRRAADLDVPRPNSVGFDDEQFRRFVLAVKNGHMTHGALWGLLEAIFGREAVRAHVTGSVPGPYAIHPGDRLRIHAELDDYFDVEFRGEDFADPSYATAAEVCRVIDRRLHLLGSGIVAAPHRDAQAALEYVRIYSGAVGLRGRLKIAPGAVQEALGLPTDLHSFDARAHRPVVVDLGSRAVVRLPATSAISRSDSTATYLSGGLPVPVVSLAAGGGKLTITTAEPHGLTTGDRFRLQGLVSTPGNLAYSFSPVASLTSPRTQMSALRLSDGRVLAVGGLDQNGVERAEIWEYTPATNAAKKLVPVLSYPRSRPGLCELDGQVFVVGGGRAGATVHCDILDLATGQILVGPPLVEPLAAPTILRLENGDLLAFGETAHPQRLPHGATEWELDPGTIRARTGAGVALLQDGRILVAGGLVGGVGIPTVEIYNPWLKRADVTASLPFGLGRVGVAVLRSGLVFVGGGTANGTSPSRASLLFDPRTQIWKQRTLMTFGRIAPVAVELEDGRVFVGGGGILYSPLGEIYDPGTDRWRAALGTAPETQIDVAIAGVPGGVATFGGDNGTHTAAALQIYRYGIGSAPDLDGLNGVHTALEPLSPTEIATAYPGTFTPTTFAGVELIAESRVGHGVGFLHDPSGVTPAHQWTTTTVSVGAGSSTREFSVVDCSAFPTTGWMVLDLGGDHQEGPIPYTARPSSELLILDPTYRFARSHPAGTTVTMLAGPIPIPPTTPTTLTDSTAGSRLARRYLPEIAAAGARVEIETIYPGRRGLAGDHLSIDESDAPWVWGGDEEE